MHRGYENLISRAESRELRKKRRRGARNVHVCLKALLEVGSVFLFFFFFIFFGGVSGLFRENKSEACDHFALKSETLCCKLLQCEILYLCI